MPRITEQLIDHLPKAELHLHIEGSLEPSMMLALARRNKIDLPYKSVEDVAAAYQFDCLQDFLDLYYLGMSALLTEQDFFDLTSAYLQRVQADNCRHVEIFFDPQAHTDRGVPFETALGGITDALANGEKELGISSKLIMCFLRHLPEESAFETLETALKYKDLIHGVGLDSSESGFPPKLFERVFEAARREGFATVAHAGEEGPAAYVSEALNLLKINRIDHGNRALDDPELTARIADAKIPLTMCPLSNLRLKVISDLVECPVKQALDAGLMVTVNSDDPSYFGGYLNDNYRAVESALSLSVNDIITLAKNSFAGSFLTDSQKQSHLDAIDRCVEAVKSGQAS